jgi:FMN-dependent oxidoreductase (nitrilotriacetate monooxygenase family)
MTQQLRLNAFVSMTPVHLSPGLWAHPRNQAVSYKSLRYWTDLARTLERGLFDAVFIADSIGVYDAYRGGPEASLRAGAQAPRHDPLMVISAMAHVTRDLGFAVTASTSHEIPAVLARRFSSLDHLTKGRIGWNIVTGFSTTGARAVGRDAVIPHDERYDRAEEFLDIAYRLWEGSWQDGAVIRDRASGVFADPAKVHVVRHDGPHFATETIHLTEPSPQRTPFLLQAGSSPRGRAFAARHAEAVVVGGPTKASITPAVRDIRAQAARVGRHPDDIAIFGLATVIPGRTRAEAQAKHADYLKYVDPEGVCALFSGWTGIDFSRVDLDAPLSTERRDDATQSMIEMFTTADPTRRWTLREVMAHNAIGGWGPLIVGDPPEVADALQDWAAETGIDGFNLSYALMPESYVDFVDLVVPELQRRGAFRTAYQPGPLRAKFQGARLLRDSHPGRAAARAFWDGLPASVA